LKHFLRSFGYGFEGLWYALKSQQNMRLHFLVAIIVVVAGFVFQIAIWEWAAVLLCIGGVISAECFNTAIEELANRVTQEQDPLIKRAKDCSSAAVLVFAMAAATVGLLIFLPKLIVWLT
jgi:diacylglycerol kinase